jgi:hypothetical protein
VSVYDFDECQYKMMKRYVCCGDGVVV